MGSEEKAKAVMVAGEMIRSAILAGASPKHVGAISAACMRSVQHIQEAKLGDSDDLEVAARTDSLLMTFFMILHLFRSPSLKQG